MENKKPVNVYLIEYLCDACNIGYMRPTGKVLLTYPPTYEHRCTHCDVHNNFGIDYPRIEYEDKK